MDALPQQERPRPAPYDLRLNVLLCMVGRAAASKEGTTQQSSDVRFFAEFPSRHPGRTLLRDKTANPSRPVVTSHQQKYGDFAEFSLNVTRGSQVRS